MTNDNKPQPEKRNDDEPDSAPVRDPQVAVIAAAAFVGGLVGAIVGAAIS